MNNQPALGQRFGSGVIVTLPIQDEHDCKLPTLCFLRGLNIEGLVWRCDCGKRWMRTSDYISQPDYRWAGLSEPEVLQAIGTRERV